MQTVGHVEKMSDIFTKYHLPNGIVMHVMTGPDQGDPHDHPWGFDTYIMRGSYIEEVFTIHADGSWTSEKVLHKRGSFHTVDARLIHRIIELPEGECITFVQPRPAEREWRYWRFNQNEPQSRLPHETFAELETA